MKHKSEKKCKSIAQNVSIYQKKCPQTEFIYLKVLREMSGQKRLKTAFELYELALNLCKQSILEQNPDISKAELKKRLFERFGYGAGRFTDKSYTKNK